MYVNTDCVYGDRSEPTEPPDRAAVPEVEATGARGNPAVIAIEKAVRLGPNLSGEAVDLLCISVVALGPTVPEARRTAYHAADRDEVYLPRPRADHTPDEFRQLLADARSHPSGVLFIAGRYFMAASFLAGRFPAAAETLTKQADIVRAVAKMADTLEVGGE